MNNQNQNQNENEKPLNFKKTPKMAWFYWGFLVVLFVVFYLIFAKGKQTEQPVTN